MTTPVAAVPAAITAFGGAQAAVSADIAAAGGVEMATVAAALAPVFGPIGADHVIATLSAMGVNLFEMGQLAAVHAGIAATSVAAAAGYAATDVSHSESFGPTLNLL